MRAPRFLGVMKLLRWESFELGLVLKWRGVGGELDVSDDDEGFGVRVILM